jgi:retinol dehydrogenase-12
LAARSPERANKAIEELKSATGKEAIFLQLDLSDLPSVRKAAEEFLSCVALVRLQRLHIDF